MISKAIKKITIGSLFIIIIFGFGIGLRLNIIKLPITKEINSLWIAELDSDIGTLEFSHNVFVGKVLRKVGSQAIYEIPETQFEVETLSNIKGDLQGTIIVSQEGGYKNGILYRSSNDITISLDGSTKQDDDGLMKPGEAYLFVVRYSEKGNWYSVLSHPRGTKLISRNGNLNKAELQALYASDERVIKLKEAMKTK